MNTMELQLKREKVAGRNTPGKLYIDNAYFCYTIEDVIRKDPKPETPENEAKVYGETAIPAGRYRITITYSPKFRRKMILVNDVPGYTGIRIHGGRDHEDSLGCPLVGYKRMSNGKLTETLQASAELFRQIDTALKERKEVYIAITDPVA